MTSTVAMINKVFFLKGIINKVELLYLFTFTNKGWLLLIHYYATIHLGIIYKSIFFLFYINLLKVQQPPKISDREFVITVPKYNFH